MWQSNVTLRLLIMSFVLKYSAWFRIRNCWGYAVHEQQFVKAVLWVQRLRRCHLSKQHQDWESWRSLPGRFLLRLQETDTNEIIQLDQNLLWAIRSLSLTKWLNMGVFGCAVELKINCVCFRGIWGDNPLFKRESRIAKMDFTQFSVIITPTQ